MWPDRVSNPVQPHTFVSPSADSRRIVNVTVACVCLFPVARRLYMVSIMAAYWISHFAFV